MKTLMFVGYSDDTFGEYGVTMDDCDNCGSLEPIQCLISAGEDKLLVVGQYSKTHLDGCWVIGVSMEREGAKLPDWSMRFKNGDCPYSPLLEIDVPDDFELTWYKNGKSS